MVFEKDAIIKKNVRTMIILFISSSLILPVRWILTSIQLRVSCSSTACQREKGAFRSAVVTNDPSMYTSGYQRYGSLNVWVVSRFGYSTHLWKPGRFWVVKFVQVIRMDLKILYAFGRGHRTYMHRSTQKHLRSKWSNTNTSLVILG